MLYSVVKSKSYKDKNNTALVKPGTGINVVEGSSGDFTINTSQKIVGLTSTTNVSGISTIDLTSYGFSSTPVVSATCLQTSTSQYTGCVITAISSTSLSIKTYQTQSTLVSILNVTISPAAVVSATVHITLIGS